MIDINNKFSIYNYENNYELTLAKFLSIQSQIDNILFLDIYNFTNKDISKYNINYINTLPNNIESSLEGNLRNVDMIIFRISTSMNKNDSDLLISNIKNNLNKVKSISLIKPKSYIYSEIYSKVLIDDEYVINNKGILINDVIITHDMYKTSLIRDIKIKNIFKDDLE